MTPSRSAPRRRSAGGSIRGSSARRSPARSSCSVIALFARWVIASERESFARIQGRVQPASVGVQRIPGGPAPDTAGTPTPTRRSRSTSPSPRRGSRPRRAGLPRRRSRGARRAQTRIHVRRRPLDDPAGRLRGLDGGRLGGRRPRAQRDVLLDARRVSASRRPRAQFETCTGAAALAAAPVRVDARSPDPRSRSSSDRSAQSHLGRGPGLRFVLASSGYVWHGRIADPPSET